MAYSKEIALVTEGLPESMLGLAPWFHYRERLAEDGIAIRVFEATDEAVFQRPFDAMMVHAWQDWRNRQRFDPYQILPLMEKMAVYRSEFPETTQIVLNHTDMSRRPYATPFWRKGDPVLYRTPAYDRSELHPFPADTIWPFEWVWGTAAFSTGETIRYKAGFIGKPSGPKGYRERVAKFTREVGIGRCSARHKYSKKAHDRLMSRCQIVVCPRGWGEQSLRHWDAWLSGKPVLTDADCDAVEMIPGVRLRRDEHYIVYEEPEQIPDMVREWTDPSRSGALEEIAHNGRDAARSYDAYGRIRDFFLRVLAAS